MASGYIYCFSNPDMPGVLKIGMTERTPDTRLADANGSDTWRPPSPYTIEFAKKVTNMKEKEKTLHLLLENYTKRIHPRREFFRVSLEEVRIFFDLMDGEMWNAEINTVVEEDTPPLLNAKGCRDMAKCFTHGQRIRHKMGTTEVWVGTYHATKNVIVCNRKKYKSLTELAEKHIKSVHSALPYERTYIPNGWRQCECEVNGAWISTYSLPNL